MCVVLTSRSSFVKCLHLCRAFTEILKADRAKFGVGDEHIIGDTVADEWQRRVDDVVAGTADTA
jgi:hypothetical protein